MATDVFYYFDSLVVLVVNQDVCPIRSIPTHLNRDGMLSCPVFQITLFAKKILQRQSQLTNEIVGILVNGQAVCLSNAFPTHNCI